MYCPNCGARNNKKQNYCRFCGLRLSAIEKLFLDQLVFGEDSKRLKNLRNVKKLIEYAVTLLFALTFVGLFTWYFYDAGIGRTLTRLSILSYFLLLGLRTLIGYFQRQGLDQKQKQEASGEVEQGEFVARETNKLIEEKPFVPAASVTERETELLYAEKKNSGGLAK